MASMKHRLYRVLRRTVVLLLLLFSLSVTVDGSKLNRRCLGETLRNSVDVARRERLQLLHRNTTCDKCPSGRLLPKYERRSIGDSYHVMIFLTDDNDEFTSLAAGLLETEQFQVTILRFQGESEKSSLHDYIFSRIPCKHEAWVRESLTVVDMLVLNQSQGRDETSSSPWTKENGNNRTCKLTAPCPFDPCTIQTAPKIFQVLNSYMTSKTQVTDEILETRPDVLVMDASFVGGLIFAERWKIPTVVTASHHTLDLAIDHDPDWMPNPEWHIVYRFYRIILQRMYSLSLTKAFMEVNQLRRELQLRPLRSPVDYFLPVVALLVEFLPTDMIPVVKPRENWQSRVHITGSLQTSCTPCLTLSSLPPFKSSSTTYQKLNSTIIVVAPPPNCTAKYNRMLMRGLILARSSLEQYDECEWDSLSCQKEATGFSILWLDFPNDSAEYFPDFVPPYVVREPSVGLLDTLSRHPNAIAAVIHCDSDSQILSSTLGVSVLCISQNERLPPPTQTSSSENNRLLGDGKQELDPREIAAQLLGLLRRRNLEQEDSDEKQTKDGPRLDGLSRTVSIVRQVAATNRKQGPWGDVLQMQRVVAQAVCDYIKSTTLESVATTNALLDQSHTFDEQQPYDTFTVLVAWFVLFSSSLYVFFKDFLLGRWRPRRNHHHHRGDSLSEGILTRLPDLDDAWVTLVQWYREQPVLMRTESFIASTMTTEENAHHRNSSNHASGHGNMHHGGNVRRRRKR